MSLEDFGTWWEAPVFVLAFAISLISPEDHKTPQILLDTINWDGMRQQGCSCKMNQDLWGSKVSLWGPTMALTAPSVVFI